MEIRLSPQQKILIEQAKEKGFLTLNDFMMVYSHTPSRRQAIERLASLGYIKQTEVGGKFEYIGEGK